MYKYLDDSKQEVLERLWLDQKKCVPQAITDDLGLPTSEMWGLMEPYGKDFGYEDLAHVEEDIVTLQKAAGNKKKLRMKEMLVRLGGSV